MELFSIEFLSALAAIIVIDLVLAGDNAIVIALAARNVPRHLQRRAILWGTAGAVIVRVAMTMVMVWLLKVPGLLFAGGAVLVWIAYRLLNESEGGGEEGHAAPAGSFWGALRTIVFADIVMGLDNVLAVAGAAHGSFLLVTLGLLISIPIVVWGSTVIMRFIERFPAFVYLGAAVLAWTAVKMMTGEPLLAEYLAAHRVIVPLAYFVVVGGVLWAGFVRNHRRIESRITAHMARFAAAGRADEESASFPATASSAAIRSNPATNGETDMTRILVPVDGSRNSLNAVRRAIERFAATPAVEVHLINIRAPFSRHIAQFVSRRNRAAHHREQAELALQPARRLLEVAGVPHAVHMEVGDRATVIAAAARRLRCDQIVMGTARKNSVTRMIEDSVTNRVLERTPVPVEVVAGDEVSRWERLGLPAGIGTALALAFLAAD